MAEAKKEQENGWAAYCKKCGKNHGEQWGLHICPDCGGEVDIMKSPPQAKKSPQGIVLRL